MPALFSSATFRRWQQAIFWRDLATSFLLAEPQNRLADGRLINSSAGQVSFDTIEKRSASLWRSSRTSARSNAWTRTVDRSRSVSNSAGPGVQELQEKKPCDGNID